MPESLLCIVNRNVGSILDILINNKLVSETPLPKFLDSEK